MKVVQASTMEWIPASHEDPKKPGVLKKVLFKKDDLHHGQGQMVNWAHLPVGERFRRHYHEDMQEIFIVITGQVKMSVDGSEFAMRAGDAIAVGPHEVHEMINISNIPCEYIVVGISQGKNGKTVVVEE